MRLPLELRMCDGAADCSEVLHRPLTARIASLPYSKHLTYSQWSLVMNFSVQLRTLEQCFTYFPSFFFFSGCGDRPVFWVPGIKQPDGEADHSNLVPRLWICGAISILHNHPFNLVVPTCSGKWPSLGKRVWFTESNIVLVIYLYLFYLLNLFLIYKKSRAVCS